MKRKIISVDITIVKGELLEHLVNLGIDYNDYFKFDGYIKSGFCPDDFFNLPVEELIFKLLQFALKLKSDSTGVRRIITTSIKALKEVKLRNDKLQKEWEEQIQQSIIMNAFVSFVFGFEYDAK